ncbi:putative transposase for insertion sequence element [Mesorhizobium amorphae CCNWGS0123]|uniref:Putative transposase for insertion sequence element n=1 Tax=Mesorhizobium amorphae CCNWGS0123 TaxID=1082933 RepID=G6YGA5_9HYPH|nr:putative transposase for insertion sequence element [Mesorhizobium amorphae CCNWGS0123]
MTVHQRASDRCTRKKLDSPGRPPAWQRENRFRMQPKTIVGFASKLPPCTVAMEACCGAHHLSRLLSDQGHEVRLMSPEYVRPTGGPYVLNVQPCRPSQALKALRLIRADRSTASRSTISFSVMSLRSSISPTMNASCALRLDAHRRPCGVASVRRSLPERSNGSRSICRPRTAPQLPRRHAGVRSLQDPGPKIFAQCSSHHPPHENGC